MELETRRRDDQNPPQPDPTAGGGASPGRDFRSESDEIDRQLDRSISDISERYHARDVINRGGQ
ncbi:MAG: hypothetical protein GX616_16140 [Planctomycetes bacterium]|nr:hypothetical protein [Planctomycetota bacterium]